MLVTLALLLNKESQLKLIFSSNGMLIKRDSTSTLVMNSPGSWSTISVANSKLFTTNM